MQKLRDFSFELYQTCAVNRILKTLTLEFICTLQTSSFFLATHPPHLPPSACRQSIPESPPRQFSHDACGLRWHRGHSSDTRLPVIGHCLGANSEFIRDRWDCVCVRGAGGFRQPDHRSHTNIPTHPLNKNNTVSHGQLCSHIQSYSKMLHNHFTFKGGRFRIQQQEMLQGC